MADGVQIAPESTGPILDTRQMADGRHREIVGIGDTSDPLTQAITNVRVSDPEATAWGLVTRPALPISPRVDVVSGTLATPGVEIDLDTPIISDGTTARLVRLLVASSIPCKWTLKKVDGGVITQGVLYTGGLMGKPNEAMDVPKGYVEQVGNGSSTLFRVSVKGLDDLNVADVTATFIWDEVS